METPGIAFPNLWGPWISFDPAQFPADVAGGCGWCSAYVTDYNAEALVFGAFSSNKLEQLDSYIQLVTAYSTGGAARRGAISTARLASTFPGRNASLLQCVLDAPDAIHFPAGLAPFGMPSGGNGPSPGGCVGPLHLPNSSSWLRFPYVPPVLVTNLRSPDRDWGLRWPGLYVAMPVLWTYEYFGNSTFGKTTLLPLLRGLASFFRCWMERRAVAGKPEEWVLVDLDDNISEMGWWMGCAEERGPACSRWQNVIMTIAFLKRLYHLQDISKFEDPHSGLAEVCPRF